MNWYVIAQLNQILNKVYPDIDSWIREDQDTVSVNINKIKNAPSVSLKNVLMYIKNYAKGKGKKIRVDNLSGGLADTNESSDFNFEQIQKGKKIELEHTDDPDIAEEISMDHLKEDPRYYDKLEKTEPHHASNWFLKMMKQSQEGEWWIQDGQAMFADGDIGDMNHEGMVIQNVQGNIVSNSDHPEFDYGEYVDWDGWKQAVAQEKMEEWKAEGRDLSQVDEEDALMEVLNELGVSDEEYQVAEGMTDARDYGMEHQGWKRVQGNNIETWTLTASDLRSIAQGLWDILESSGSEENPEFNIYVHSTGKWYNDIPLEAIESENISVITNQTEQTATQRAYDKAFDKMNKPQNSYYKDWE